MSSPWDRISPQGWQSLSCGAMNSYSGICIFIYIITKVQIVLEFVEKLEGMIAIDSTYIGLVIKMVGITYAAEFAVNVCKDAGYGVIAGQIENFAKMSILVVSLPVLMAFIDTIGSLL